MYKRIIIFVGALSSGGAEKVISIISKNLFAYFKEVEVFLYYNRQIFYDLDNNIKVRIIEKETGTKNFFKNMIWLRKNVNKNDVFVSFLAPFNMFAILALFNKIKIVVADRNDPKFIPQNFFKRKLRNFLYIFAKRVICQTENNKKYFNKNIQNKITVIYNPIYISEKIGVALEEEKENIIVSVGRLTKQKNQKLLINSFEKFLQLYPDYKLFIYGEGKERKDLEKYIKYLKLEKQIFLPGAFNDIHSRIKKAKVFVITSDYEGMPNALLEAMSLGLPCISTKVSGATELIKNYKNGILVERNSSKISKEIIKVIENKEYAYQLGVEATKIYNKLNESKIITQWINAIVKY